MPAARQGLLQQANYEQPVASRSASTDSLPAHDPLSDDPSQVPSGADTDSASDSSPFRQRAKDPDAGSSTTSPSPGNAVDLGQTLQKLLIMTLGVLAAGVALIVGLKKFGFKPGQGFAPDSGSIRVVDSLNLGTKGNVQILEVGRQRLAVASDTGGVKSMVLLNSTFTEEMESMERRLEPRRDPRPGYGRYARDDGRPDYDYEDGQRGRARS